MTRVGTSNLERVPGHPLKKASVHRPKRLSVNGGISVRQVTLTQLSLSVCDEQCCSHTKRMPLVAVF